MDRLFREISLKRISGGSFKWFDNSPASLVLNNDFFESNTGNIYNEDIFLNSENIIINTYNLELNQNIIISQDIIINNINNMLLNSNIFFDLDSQINSFSSLEINQSISLNQSNDLLILGGLDIFETTSLNSGSEFLENAGANVNDLVLYVTDNNIQVNPYIFIDMLTNLYQSANINNVSYIEYLNQISVQTENELLVSSFLDAFNQLSLLGTSATDFEVLQIIDSVFNLNIDSNILFENILSSDVNLLFDINCNIIFDGFIFRIDYSKREIVRLKSTITNNYKLKTKFTNNVLTLSYIENDISLKSNSTNLYICKSLVTNEMNLKSKING